MSKFEKQVLSALSNLEKNVSELTKETNQRFNNVDKRLDDLKVSQQEIKEMILNITDNLREEFHGNDFVTQAELKQAFILISDLQIKYKFLQTKTT